MANYLLGLGSQFPTFSKTAVVSLEQGKEFATITSEDHKKDGKWLVMFWWPKDFTFVCPSELIALDHRVEAFQSKNVEVIGVSIDSQFTHNAWRNTPIEKGGIGAVKYTLVAESEADLKSGKISVTSPIGKGLLGKSVGQIAEITVPNGKLIFEVLEISRD